MSALTATCATRKVPFVLRTKMRSRQFCWRQRVQPSGCLRQETPRCVDRTVQVRLPRPYRNSISQLRTTGCCSWSRHFPRGAPVRFRSEDGDTSHPVSRGPSRSRPCPSVPAEETVLRAVQRDAVYEIGGDSEPIGDNCDRWSRGSPDFRTCTRSSRCRPATSGRGARGGS